MIYRNNNFQRLQLKYDKLSMGLLVDLLQLDKIDGVWWKVFSAEPQHFVVVKPTESRLPLNTVDAFNSLTNKFVIDSLNFQCKRQFKYVSYLRCFSHLKRREWHTHDAVDDKKPDVIIKNQLNKYCLINHFHLFTSIVDHVLLLLFSY